MKKLLLLLILVPMIAFSQGYADAGYAHGLKSHYHSSGIFFGAGMDIKNYSVGFNAEVLDLNYSENFAVASLDVRYNYKMFFVSAQPGKILYDKKILDKEIRGRFSYCLLAGANYKIFTFSAGYQSVKFSEGKRGGFIKANLGFRID